MSYGTPTLFRAEALESRRDLWLGEVQLLQPISIRIVTIVCVLFFIATLLLLIFGTYTRRVHASGLLEPDIGLITVASPAAGRISATAAHEGDKVTKGQLLFLVDIDSISSNGRTHVRVVSQLQVEKGSMERQRSMRMDAAAIEKRALQTQLDNTQTQQAGLKRQVELQKKVTQALGERVGQLQSALSRGIARATDVQDQNYRYIQADAQLAQFEQSGFELDGKIADLKSQLAVFDDKLSRELAEMDRTIAQLDRQIVENEAQQAIEVRAPEDGVLTSIRVHPGQQVAAGGSLLTLLPSAGHLQADLFVDSSAIGMLDVGKPVLLRYAAFPFERYGLYPGRVVEITKAPFAADNSSGSSASRNDALYRIVVRPENDTIKADGEQRKLESGMQVEADIALEKRALYSWLLDPLNSLRHRALLVTKGAQG